MSPHDRDKVIALLKSVASPCAEARGGVADHSWRKCRRCLAMEELECDDVRALLTEFLQVHEQLQQANERLLQLTAAIEDQKEPLSRKLTLSGSPGGTK